MSAGKGDTNRSANRAFWEADYWKKRTTGRKASTNTKLHTVADDVTLKSSATKPRSVVADELTRMINKEAR